MSRQSKGGRWVEGLQGCKKKDQRDQLGRRAWMRATLVSK